MKTKLLTLFYCLFSATSLFAYNFAKDGLYYDRYCSDAYYSTHCYATVTYKSNENGIYNENWNIQKAVIPSSLENGYTIVSSIGRFAFKNCSSLTSIEISNGISSISDRIFENCISLNSIIVESGNTMYDSRNNCNAIIQTSTNTLIAGCQNTIIPDGITSIGTYAFSDCNNLTSIEIPNSVTSIADYAFSGCSSLTSVTIGNGVTTIGDYAFSGCSSLTSVTIPNSVTTIGDYAFSGCSSLTSVTIGESVTTIGSSAFPTGAVKEIHFTGTMADWCTKLFNPSSISSSYTLYINGEAVTNAVIPNSVTTIGGEAFCYCSSLTKVIIGDGATSIGSYAFYGCTYLEDITIGSSIETNGISNYAFANCPYLMSVTCKAVFPPVINSNVFTGCGVLSGVDLYVPEESVKRYKKADVWSEFNIVGKDLGTDDPTNPTTDQFTITWQDEDGNVIKTDKVENATIPAYTGTTPTKEGYDFVGWLPNIKPATEDTKYTTYFIPQAQAEEKVYTVNINGENCSLNINNQYPEGTVITVEAVADECFEFQQWSDGNKDNPRTVTVTKDMNLTAEFNKLRYTVTGQTETGSGGKVQIIKK